jgi:hypothetical protein
LPGKGNPHFPSRISRNYILALKLEARRDGISPSEKMRRILREHFEGVYATQSSGGLHLETLATLTKEFITRAQLSRQANKIPLKAEKGPELPGTEKRSDLEELTWRAVQAAVDYSKTEDAAKDAEARLLALRVANGLMRTELMILKHQDDAYVGALLKELGVDADGLTAKTRKES